MLRSLPGRVSRNSTRPDSNVSQRQNIRSGSLAISASSFTSSIPSMKMSPRSNASTQFPTASVMDFLGELCVNASSALMSTSISPAM